MIFTSVYNGVFSIASKNDLDDQNLLLATMSCVTFNKWWFEVSLNLRNLSYRQRNLL
jgi:hypothetical protein